MKPTQNMRELVAYVEHWLSSASEAVEPPDVLRRLLKKAPDQLPVEDSSAEILLQADKRNRRRRMDRTSDLVLVRREPAAYAARGVSPLKDSTPFRKY
jgi:hypothetical protein